MGTKETIFDYRRYLASFQGMDNKINVNIPEAFRHVLVYINTLKIRQYSVDGTDD